MKGVVFVEFVNLLDELLGVEGTEELIEEAQLESEGAYTTTGNYPSMEMHCMVGLLSQKLDLPVETLHDSFGQYLFKKFTVRYAHLIEESNSGFEILKKIDDHIHPEVLKLYPKSSLPSFRYEQPEENILHLHYTSERFLPNLATGLIKAAMEHFKEEAQVTIIEEKPSEKSAVFEIKKIP